MNTRTDTLNDSLDDLIGGARTERAAPPAAYAAVQAKYTEKCGKCRGTGQTPWGVCFRCKGAGGKTFKTSPDARAKNRDAASARKDRTEQESLDAFKVAQPEVFAWIEAERARFDFAAKMRETIIRFGDLTTGQREACERMIEKSKARAAERAERTQNAPQVDTAGIDRLKVAFDKARAYAAAKAPGLSIRNPKITIGGITISPAKAESINAGALYVKQGGDYLGKIMGGKFLSVAGCSPAQRDQVLAFVADPAKAAKAYGQETGICCVCNATLKSKWRLRGIGPVCAEKMGWAGLAEDFGVEL